MSESKSRREFLTGAAGIAALPVFFETQRLFAAPLVADPQFKYDLKRADKPVRVGFIGVGGRGTTLLKALLETQRAEVVAICDLRPEAIKAATELCKGMSPRGYENYHELLDQKDIDAVFIATPVDLHCQMATETLHTGKFHLYCEKPLGLNAHEAEKVHKAASKCDKAFQVGFQWVYNSNFRSAVEAVHQGVIGDVCFVRAQRHGSGDLPLGQKGWLMDRKRSGDIIVEQAVHEMNIFCWALQGHPVRAMGLGGINYYKDQPKGRTVMDHYSLTLEFPKEVLISYSHMFYAPKPLDGMYIYIFGTKGAVDMMGGNIYLTDKNTPAPRNMNLTGDDTFNAIYSFLGKVKDGGKPDADADKALAATKTAVLGRTAIYKRKPATWGWIS